MATRRVLRLLFLVPPLLAGFALLVPGNPAYWPSLLAHYSHYQQGHSLGYWMRALDRDDSEVRYQAIFALGAMGPDAAEAAPALATILADDPDPEARHQAALALAKMAPASAEAVPALAHALDEDREPAVRMNAALALFRLGAQSRSAAAVLTRALGRRVNRTNLGTCTFTIQEMAALALGRATAGGPEGVAPLTEALASARTVEKRRIVIRALAEIGPPARAAEPRLQALLGDDSAEVRQAAEEAIQQIEGG